jgi:hypothetical protein
MRTSNEELKYIVARYIKRFRPKKAYLIDQYLDEIYGESDTGPVILKHFDNWVLSQEEPSRTMIGKGS